MKAIFFKFVLAPAVLAAAVVTQAATAETTLKVPFNFTVAGQLCPAGTYAVEANNVVSSVTLRSKDSAKSFSWNVGPGEPAPTDTRVVLNFDEVGQTHALRSVQFGHMVTSSLRSAHKQSERISSPDAQGQ